MPGRLRPSVLRAALALPVALAALVPAAAQAHVDYVTPPGGHPASTRSPSS